MNVIQHPFTPDLSKLTVEELQNKIAELTKNLNWAYRMQNSSMIHQLNMILSSYQMQYHKKMDELLNKQGAQNSIKIDH